MKKRYVLGACVVPIIVWLLVPLLVQYPHWVFSKIFSACVDSNSTECLSAYAKIGQSGDAFGVASSLFSGLALFAVAATLWVEYAARRSSRKPLLVCTIEQAKEISFDEPSHTQPRSVRFQASINVKAANDTAMNIVVKAKVEAGKFDIDLGSKYVQVPLLDGQSNTLEFCERIGEKKIKALVDEIARSTDIKLFVDARCNSLEGVIWETSVSYSLNFTNGDDDLMRKLLHDETALLLAWQGGAAVSMKYQIEDDSWLHKRVD
jgi:hypothetical protein